MSDADSMSLQDFENSGSEYVPTPSGSSISSRSSEDTLPGPSGLAATESQIGITENESRSAEPDIEVESSNELKISTRKRIAKKSNWKKHVSKVQRNSGKSYKTVKGVMKPAKTLNALECPCPLKCHQHFSENNLRSIFENFYKIGDHDLQNAYLCGQMAVFETRRSYKKSIGESRRSSTRIYKLPGVNNDGMHVCKRYFKQILQITDGRITRALKHRAPGSGTTTPKLDQRGRHPPHNKTSVEATEIVKEFINKFPRYSSHYSRNKNIQREFLAPTLNISIMYELYRGTVEMDKVVSKFVFTKIFSENFNLHFRAPISDSCKKCDSFKVKIEAAGDPSEKERITSERDLHHRKAESARTGMQLDSKLNKEEYAVIAFDLMKTLPTPVISTGVAYYKRQLWTYCLGIHDLITNKSFMYTWNEGIASRGPQEIGSCIMHYVKANVKCKNLIMYSDQCGG